MKPPNPQKSIHTNSFARRVFCTLVGAIFLAQACAPRTVNAAQIANVQYVHDFIAAKTGITIPIKATNPTQAANVKYLLATIDRANELSPTSTNTDLKNNVLATSQAVDTIVTHDAVSRLFNCNVGGYYKDGFVCANCGAGNYCAPNTSARTACIGGATFCPYENHMENPVPVTINLTQCRLNEPMRNLTEASACLGVNTTVGHWQLVSSYTGSGQSLGVVKTGSVPPGLYRVESNNTTLGLGAIILPVTRTMYYAHFDILNESTARLNLSFGNDNLSATGCNWNFTGYQGMAEGCVLSPAGVTFSLEKNNAHVDWVAGEQVPGITRANTETPLGASAIYKWVN